MPVEAPDIIEMDTAKITEVDLKYLDFDTSSLSDKQGKVWKDLKELGKRYINKYDKVGEKDDLAVVTGRFQPPHLGHLYQILAALEVADHVAIVLGSSNSFINNPAENPDVNRERAIRQDVDNPFPAKQREILLKHFLKKIGKERGESLLDRVSFVPSDDVWNDKKWGDNTIRDVGMLGKGRIDVVVANDGWVSNIFQKRSMRVLPVPFLLKPNGDRYEATQERIGLRTPEGNRPAVLAAKGQHIVRV